MKTEDHRKSVTMLICAAMLLVCSAATAQCNPSEGTDFWVVFLSNHNATCGDDLRLTVSGDEEAVVEVTVGNGVWTHVDTMAADSLLEVYIPRSLVLDYQGNPFYDFEVVTNTGVHVHTSTLTTLQAHNRCYASSESAAIVPTRYLGDRYIAHDYGTMTAPEVGFLAVEDGTVITTVLPVNTFKHSAGDTLNIQLDRGDVFIMTTGYELITVYPNMHYTQYISMFNGMEVTSNGKPFAMFQGNECADIPTEFGGCDHTYEQSIPVEFWGREFVIPSTGGTYHPTLIQVTSSEDNCTVYLGNDTLCQLQARESMVAESYSYEIPDSVLLPPDTAWHIHATKPIAVSVFMLGCRYEPIAVRGDPSSVFVPPMEQGVDHIRVNVTNTDRVDRHYIQVACSTDVRGAMRLNNESIADLFTTLDETYSTANIPVEPGSYLLENLRGTFISFFSGYGQQESYAYTSGMAYNNLHTELYVDGERARSRPRGFQLCHGDSLTFSLTSDNSLRFTKWMVDDSLANTGMYVFGRRFNNPGTYTVYLVVSYTDDTMRIDTLCAKVIVYGQTHSTENVAICPDETYTWHDHTYSQSGYYTDSVLAGYVCYDYYSLNLKVADSTSVSLAVHTLCKEHLYRLEARNDADYYITWHASPDDPDLTGHEHDSALFLNPQRNTRYTATVTPNPQSHCTTDISTTLTPITIPVAAIKINNTAPDYENATIHAIDATEGSLWRQWWVDEKLMEETGKYLAYTVDATADSVTVTLAAYTGLCGDTTAQTVYMDRNAVYMPNAFCPSCDDNNRFGPVGTGIEEGEMYVYNREGLLMYHTDDLTAWWDGTHNGVPCPQSAYVWLLRYRMRNYNGFYTASGTVTLLR